MAAVIHEELKHYTISDGYIEQINKLIEKKEGRYDDLDSGRAGLLFAGYFLNANIGGSVISTDSMTDLAQAIVNRGATLMTKEKPFLQWHGPNDSGLWLGASHGSAGIIYALLAFAPQILENATAASLIKQTIEHTVASQLPSGNFPSEYWTESDDMLVQWDHGAPGVTPMLVRAATLFQEDTFMQAAKKAMDCVWNRGLLSKGLMQCHGIAGNIYMTLDFYQQTGDKKHLYRAIQLQEFVLQYPLLHDVSVMRQPDPVSVAYYHWVGSYQSAIVLWADFLSSTGPAKAQMTGFHPRFIYS